MRSIKKMLNKSVGKNILRRFICSVNWNYHRAELIERLDSICLAMNAQYMLIAAYGKKNTHSKRIEGNDSITVKFLHQYTNIEYHDAGRITLDHENGANLIIAHSDVGFDTIFLHPATSKQSGAKHQKLIIYHSTDGKRFSDKVLRRAIRDLCNYHMYTSVLYENTFTLRLKIINLKFRSFYYTYYSPDKKFEFSSGIYIPLASLFVAFVALIVAIISLKIQSGH